MHLRGWGTKPDVAKAAQMWDAASRAGHLLASYNLAHLHLGGHTRAQAPCKAAAALLKRVAEKGFPAPQVSSLHLCVQACASPHSRVDSCLMRA